ncbi:hypothetical protein L1887_42054 [Cichorium endivia]|nr:hypothetical protein L1887_42054 [Cichorium endivia]
MPVSYRVAVGQYRHRLESAHLFARRHHGTCCPMRLQQGIVTAFAAGSALPRRSRHGRADRCSKPDPKRRAIFCTASCLRVTPSDSSAYRRGDMISCALQLCRSANPARWLRSRAFDKGRLRPTQLGLRVLLPEAIADRAVKHIGRLAKGPQARTRRAALRTTRRHLHALMPNVPGSLRVGLSEADANSTSSFVGSATAGHMLLAYAKTWRTSHPGSIGIAHCPHLALRLSATCAASHPPAPVPLDTHRSNHGAPASVSRAVDAVDVAALGPLALPRASLVRHLALLLSHPCWFCGGCSQLASIGSSEWPHGAAHRARQRRAHAKVARHLPHLCPQRLARGAGRRARLGQPCGHSLLQLGLQISLAAVVGAAGRQELALRRQERACHYTVHRGDRADRSRRARGSLLSLLGRGEHGSGCSGGPDSATAHPGPRAQHDTDP